MVLAESLLDCSMALFLLNSDDRWCREQLAGQGYECFSEALDRAWLLLPEPAAVLIDTRLDDGLGRLIATARDRGIPVISIHDLGLNPLPSDLVIDGSIISNFSQAEFLRGAQSFGGPDFMILDPGFRRIHQMRKSIRKRIRSVVINLGGGDARSFFPRILEGLRLWAQEVEVIGLRGFIPWGQEQLERTDWHPLHFRWESASADRFLLDADLAITAGGLSAYEALCAGTPLLALSYDPLQESTIQAMAAAGACVNLGSGNDLDPIWLARVFSGMDADEGKRRRISRNGRKLVDGRGAERVSHIIRRRICERSGTGDREFAE